MANKRFPVKAKKGNMTHAFHVNIGETGGWMILQARAMRNLKK
jgi:hypothetical protein